MPQQTKIQDNTFRFYDLISAIWKHRVLMLITTLIGVSGSYLIHLQKPALYYSTARMLVRYVIDRGGPEPNANTPNSPRDGGDRVILTEIEILTSKDLSRQVATKLGPTILNTYSELPPDLNQAADVILSNLQVTTGPAGNTLHLSYGNPKPETAKKILKSYIEGYFTRHLEIHRSASVFDAIEQQTGTAKEELLKTENKLNNLRMDAGLINLSDVTTALSSQRDRTNEELMKAKAEFAEQEAKIRALEPLEVSQAISIVENSEQSNSLNSSPPPDTVSEYRSIVELIPFLRKRDLELRLKFKMNNQIMIHNQEQLQRYESRQRALVTQYPILETPGGGQNAASFPQWDLIMERAKLAATRAKISIYQKNLEELDGEFATQYAVGNRIEELNRKKILQDEEFRSLESNLRQAKLDLSLDPSRMPNITLIENPTEAQKSHDPKTRKWMLTSVGSGIAIGILIAITMESRNDRRIRYPSDFGKNMKLKIALIIPWIPKSIRKNRQFTQQQASPHIEPSPNPHHEREEKQTVLTKSATHTPHYILSYTNQLRDHIILNYKLKQNSPKPKLIALIGINHGSGTSTIAAGLAKSFSALPGAKVLLVDLSSKQPEESPLFAIVPRHSIQSAIGVTKGNSIKLSAQGLYYANPTSNKLNSYNNHSPLNWVDLIPELRRSSFDYVIFDLESAESTKSNMSAISVMDRAFIIIDANTTRRNNLMLAISQLQDTETKVECVFNKYRSDLPLWIREPASHYMV